MSIIETINNELKNIGHAEHSGHGSSHNFPVDLLSAPAACCFFFKEAGCQI
jgi:hypothetical protein